MARAGNPQGPTGRGVFSYRARYPDTPTTPPIFHTRGNFPGLGFLWLGFWTFNTLLNWWDFGAILAKYSRVTVEEQPRRDADGLNPGNRLNCRKCRRPNARGRKSNEPRTNHEKRAVFDCSPTVGRGGVRRVPLSAFRKTPNKRNKTPRREYRHNGPKTAIQAYRGPKSPTKYPFFWVFLRKSNKNAGIVQNLPL